MGQLQHGLYDDPCDSMSEMEINRFYGFEDNGEPDDDVTDNSSDDSSAYDSDSELFLADDEDFNIAEVSMLNLDLLSL